MSAFWHWFVVIVTVGSMAGSLWLLFANARAKPGETEDHVWDDDLRERNNPLPRWWLNLFVLTVVFGAGYLVFYPGLGNFAGTLGWTQQAESRSKLAQVQGRRGELHARFRDLSLPVLAQQSEAQSLGRELFLNNCAGCHGADARGALGFPDLTDQDWLYGGRPEDVLASVAHGRRGTMPQFNGALAPAAVNALVRFVPRWSDPTLDVGARATGLKQYATTCAACHGPEGRGNAALGAPDLTDAVWLHGGTPERIRETILFGRSSAMPAHGEMLSSDEIRLVSAYVYGLSRSP